MHRDKIAERFWSRVAKSDQSACWPWPGAKDRDGYGYSGWALGERRCHRRAWALVNGPVPDGMLILHLCVDSRDCCNPDHLYAGTEADNMRDRAAIGRYASGTEHHFSKRPELASRGQNHYLSKMSDLEVQSVRSQYTGARGEQARLARQFGVTQTTIWRILNNQSRVAIGE